jgi:hypothetical protein
MRPWWSGSGTRSTGYGAWAEDDPDSDLYAEATCADEVIGYMAEHS